MKVQATFYKHQEWDWEGVVPDDLKDEGEIRFWIDSNVRQDEWELAGEYMEDGPVTVLPKDREPRWIRTKVMSMALLAFSIGDCDVFIEGEYEELQGPLAYEIDILRAEGLTFIIQEKT
jgi:hypothetical protein